jgi:hypothetical protein
LLKPSQELFILPTPKKHVIIRQIGESLFDFTDSFIPVTFHAERIHVTPFCVYE